MQASTRRQRGGIDHLRATGRYIVLDDVAGDPISLTAGLSYIESFIPGLHDVSSFHHGRAEGELFLSVGKERRAWASWIRRWWAAGAIGIGDRGSPWLRGNVGMIFALGRTTNANCFAIRFGGWGIGICTCTIFTDMGLWRISRSILACGIVI